MELTDRLWSFEEIVAGMDAIAPKAGRPKVYKRPDQKISNHTLPALGKIGFDSFEGVC